MLCNVTGGIPSPSISWLRNGIPLEISDRMQLLSGGKILEIIQSQVQQVLPILIQFCLTFFKTSVQFFVHSYFSVTEIGLRLVQCSFYA